MNIELNFPPKLRGARSRLYRSQILQVNIRWKALDEIYKIYMLLHRSDLNISKKLSNVFAFFSLFPCHSFLNILFESDSYSNYYFLTKFGVDTEDNESYKV